MRRVLRIWWLHLHIRTNFCIYHPIDFYHFFIHSSSTSGKSKAKAENGNIQIPEKQAEPFNLTQKKIELWEYWYWYQMVDGREATWSCSMSGPLPSLAQVSARKMSSKSWSASTSTSTPWLGLVSIPLRRLAQAGTHSPDSASLYCEDTLVTKRRGMASTLELKISSESANEFWT